MATTHERPSHDDQPTQAAKNQSFFRDVNERVVELSPEPHAALEVLCECADTACVEPIPISRDEYEAVREHPSRFPVHPGHVRPEVERVTAQNERYWVVEKFGKSGDVAEELDPRSRGGA